MSARSHSPAPPKKICQGRSPAFPFISLSKALDRLVVFRVAQGGRPKHFSPLGSAFAAWGTGPKTAMPSRRSLPWGTSGCLSLRVPATFGLRGSRPMPLQSCWISGCIARARCPD